MRFSLVFFTLLFTSAVQSQLIAATIFAIEIAFDILSEIATEAAVAEVATSAELAMTEGTGAAAGEYFFEAVNVESSATVVNGAADVLVTGVPSASLFGLVERSLGYVAGKPFLTKDFVWSGLRITERTGKRFWDPVITGQIKTGFNVQGGKFVADGGSAIIKRTAAPNAHAIFGSPVATGGYKIRMKNFIVKPRPLASQ